jgi:hypothetical protein
MALLPYVDESKASDKTREILGNTPRKLNVARMIANASDAVFQNFSRLGNSLMTRGKLDKKLREIAIELDKKLREIAIELNRSAVSHPSCWVSTIVFRTR